MLEAWLRELDAREPVNARLARGRWQEGRRVGELGQPANAVSSRLARL